jgi:ABC-type dipeptide/oligopeptide/nickel transport systems, permease components
MDDVKKIADDELFSFVEFNAAESEKTGSSDYSYWGSVLKTFLKNKVAVILLIVMVSLITFSFFAVATAKFPYDQLNRENMLLVPNGTYWFGTDTLGRDMWARTWYGTTISMRLAGIVTIIDVLVGVSIGCIWGYVKQTDRFFTELYNIIFNIPQMIYLMLLTYILSAGFWTLVLALCSTGWLGMSRNVRNLVFMIRDREYNLASRCLGTPLYRMVIKNLLPYLVSVVILRLALMIPAVISLEVTLSFLGLGLPGTMPSLGQLLSQGRSKFVDFPHLLVYPTLIVSIITISFYLIGNAFSDASDPRNHV